MAEEGVWVHVGGGHGSLDRNLEDPRQLRPLFPPKFDVLSAVKALPARVDDLEVVVV